MTSSVSEQIGQVLDDAQSHRLPAHSEPPSPRARQTRTATWGALTVAMVVLLAYALLQNPYWVHGGDSEVYICLARSLAKGKGFIFNGQPIAMVPPGWPWLLAGAMKLTASFKFLKLIPMLAMTIGMVLYYLALRQRVAPPHRAALAVIVTALLAPVYVLTVWFHAEGAFIACIAAALLVAAQINDGKQQWWRIALLGLLCGASLLARTAGIVFFPVVAGMLLRGQLIPRINRLWIGAVISGLVTLATFLCLRHAMRVTPDQIDPRFDASLSVSYNIVNDADQVDDTYSSRLYDAPMWIAGLFFQPATNSPFPGFRTAARIACFIIVGLLLIKLCTAIRRREWVWLGVAIYAGFLIVDWPSPVSRYFIPIAPFLFIGTLDGMTWLTDWIRRPDWREGWGLGLRAGFVGLVLLPNLGSFAIDVWAMRSRHFYDRFEGGIHRSLVAATNWLREHDTLHDGDIAVSRRFLNQQADRYTNGWIRAACTLTDTAVVTVPDPLSREPNRELQQWLAEHHVRYYLYLPGVYVERALHFRYLSWNGFPTREEDMAWRLYKVSKDGHVKRVEISDDEFHPIRRVPGL